MTTIQIHVESTTGTTWQTVDAMIYGPLAVHRHEWKGWTVTHVQSGTPAAWMPSQAKARRLAKALHRRDEWALVPGSVSALAMIRRIVLVEQAKIDPGVL